MARAGRKLQDGKVRGYLPPESQFLEEELNKAVTLGLASTWLEAKFHDNKLNLSCSLSVFST